MFMYLRIEVFMPQFFKTDRSVSAPAKRSKGIVDAIRALKVGESVLLPTSAGSLISTVGYLRARGKAKAGEFTVRSEGMRAARIWRLQSSG
jgi:hypothetical protein